MHDTQLSQETRIEDMRNKLTNELPKVTLGTSSVHEFNFMALVL